MAIWMMWTTTCLSEFARRQIIAICRNVCLLPVVNETVLVCSDYGNMFSVTLSDCKRVIYGPSSRIHGA